EGDRERRPEEAGGEVQAGASEAASGGASGAVELPTVRRGQLTAERERAAEPPAALRRASQRGLPHRDRGPPGAAPPGEGGPDPRDPHARTKDPRADQAR